MKPQTKIELPQKRHAVVYVRVSDANKLWLEQQAERHGVSESVYINALLERERKAN